MTKISIIIPVYNVEKYLAKCIDSILAQTFPDFELILVNDGSPDNCKAICDEYADKDSRISVIHQNNKGVSNARNTGIAKAKGEFVCFVDGDDMLSPFFCEKLYHVLADSDAGFAACRLQRFENEPEYEESYSNSLIVENMTGIQYFNQQLDQGFSACGKLYRSTVLQSVSFMEGKRYEDILFSCDLVKTQKKEVGYLDEGLYYYRQNRDGFMLKSQKCCSQDRIFAGEYLLNTVCDMAPELKDKAFVYALAYPWSFVDGIYISKAFHKNRAFLKQLRCFLKKNAEMVKNSQGINTIIKHRMNLFRKSPLLYGLNAYSRLFRVYLFHLLKKDAYADGHGI